MKKNLKFQCATLTLLYSLSLTLRRPFSVITITHTTLPITRENTIQHFHAFDDLTYRAKTLLVKETIIHKINKELGGSTVLSRCSEG